jgi:hypothetical protein
MTAIWTSAYDLVSGIKLIVKDRGIAVLRLVSDLHIGSQLQMMIESHTCLCSSCILISGYLRLCKE